VLHFIGSRLIILKGASIWLENCRSISIKPRLGVFSTSNKDGKVDSAIFGSPQMIEEQTVIVALGKGRTAANLQENTNAVYMIMEPGTGILDWKGVRVYLRMKDYATSGPQLDQWKIEAAKIIGEESGKDDPRSGYLRGHGSVASDRLWAGLGEII
jgi:hypothetical protein